MEHFYQNIFGYFTWPDFYSYLAKVAVYEPDAYDPDACWLRPSWKGVEVGVFRGQSAAYLGVELINQKAETHFCLDLVDLFPDEPVAEVARRLQPIAEVLGVIRQEDSAQAARHYQDESLDFVFIDADHSYQAVKRDIGAWLPKVKPGGIIAGHDYTPDPFIGDGVIRAVNETFPQVMLWRGERWGDDRMKSTGLYYSVWEVRV